MAYIRCSGNIGGSLKVRTASGNPCSFSTNLADTLVSLKASIVASGGNGTPATPIPIVGHSELNLVRCGKNLAPHFRDSEKTQNGITVIPQADGSIRLHGTSTGQSNYLISMVDYVKKLPAGTYTFNIGNYQNYVYAQIVASEHTLYSYQAKDTYTYNNGLSISRLDIGITGGAYGVPIDITIYPQLELGSTATAYAPYNGTPYLVSFGQTVYGGEYDANAGKVRITWSAVDLGTQDWNEVSQRFNTTSTLPNAKVGNYIGCLCSIYETRTDVLQRVEPFSICIANNGYCYIYDTRFNDAASFKTAMDGIIVAYELATPIEIDVSELSVDTIVGTNNVFHDGNGDTEVKYLYKA